MMKSARGEMDVAQSLPLTAYTSTAIGVGVSKVGFYGVLAVASMGTVTDGTHTFKLQDSDDNVTFTDVANKYLQGSFINVDNTKSNSIQRVAYLGLKKYVRVATTVTGATTGGTYEAFIVRSFPGNKPVP